MTAMRRLSSLRLTTARRSLTHWTMHRQSNTSSLWTAVAAHPRRRGLQHCARRREHSLRGCRDQRGRRRTAVLHLRNHGLAKGVLHKQRWIAGVAATQKHAVDLQAGDLYWSTGDLGWLTGAINTLGAWFWGTSLFTYEGEFDPTEWADLLDEFPITVLFSVPTAYRMLREKEDVLDDIDLDLRHALSIGEPLSAGVVEWGKENLGVTILDTYGQTETGNMIINNYPTMELRPGSMGKPLPGIEADIVDPDTGEVLPPGETGEIAERGDYPCFFAEYWNKPEKTRRASSTVPTGNGISRVIWHTRTRTGISGSRGGQTT